MYQFLIQRQFHTILAFLLVLSCRQAETPSEILFNGHDLTGWDTYLAPRSKTGGDPSDSIGHGLNNDPDHVFSIVTVDDSPAIRISGETHGGISTQKEYENYHFSCEFKWGLSKTKAFKDRKRDSGVLYHAVGPHGADYGAWMRSQEFQIQEGDCGDYWGVAGGAFDVPTIRNADGFYVYNSRGEMRSFSATSAIGRRCIKNPDAEKPNGQWNTIEIYSKSDTSVHIVNGVVNMILYRSRQQDNGVETILKKGKIQIQSEGSEIFYRNIKITPIAEIPRSILEGKN